MSTRRPRTEVVATINGFEIERERIGADVYWNAYRLNDEGYTTVSMRNLGSKAKAVAAAGAYKEPVSGSRRGAKRTCRNDTALKRGEHSNANY